MVQVNGQISPWGYGAVRAMVPSNLGGPFGSPSQRLPAYGLNPAYNGYPGYSSGFGKMPCSFGRSLTPGGVTSERGWGLKYSSSKKKKRRSYKRKKSKRKKSKRKSKRKRKSKKRKKL